jgi:hypothetical protein
MVSAQVVGRGLACPVSCHRGARGDSAAAVESVTSIIVVVAVVTWVEQRGIGAIFTRVDVMRVPTVCGAVLRRRL